MRELVRLSFHLRRTTRHTSIFRHSRFLSILSKLFTIFSNYSIVWPSKKLSASRPNGRNWSTTLRNLLAQDQNPAPFWNLSFSVGVHRRGYCLLKNVTTLDQCMIGGFGGEREKKRERKWPGARAQHSVTPLLSPTSPPTCLTVSVPVVAFRRHKKAM